MSARNENIILEKLQSQTLEADKIQNGLQDFNKKYDLKFEAHVDALLKIVNELQGANSDTALTTDMTFRICTLLSDIKSDFTDATILHRGIHVNISKFKKSIDKAFVDDTSAFAKYISGDPSKDLPLLSNEPFPETNIYKTADAMSDDELFSTILVEELVRNGYGPLAILLAKEVGLSEEHVGMEKFREVGSMVCALKSGDLEPAKAWLEAYEETIGAVAKHLRYVLSKLEFLSDVQKCNGNPAAVIGCLSKISPFSKDYPEDFKHIMGSLLFMNRDLTNTPYADLSLTDQPKNLSHFITSSGVSLPTLPMVSLFTSAEGGGGDTEPMDTQDDVGAAADSDESFKPNAFIRAAHLFGDVACQHQLKLSTIDPLRMAFASGLKVLPKLYETQKAFTWLQNYTRADPHGIQTLPEAQVSLLSEGNHARSVDGATFLKGELIFVSTLSAHGSYLI